MTTQAIPNHLDQGTLRMCALGDLPTCQVTMVERHLANCAFCRSDLRKMEELFVAVRTLNKTVPQRQCPA
jgi:hypothetical protein